MKLSFRNFENRCSKSRRREMASRHFVEKEHGFENFESILGSVLLMCVNGC